MKNDSTIVHPVGTFFISSTNTATTVSSEDQVHQVYVSYYGRPGDAAGVDYWAGELDKSGGDLTAIIRAFGTSPNTTNDSAP